MRFPDPRPERVLAGDSTGLGPLLHRLPGSGKEWFGELACGDASACAVSYLRPEAEIESGLDLHKETERCRIMLIPRLPQIRSEIPIKHDIIGRL